MTAENPTLDWNDERHTELLRELYQGLHQPEPLSAPKCVAAVALTIAHAGGAPTTEAILDYTSRYVHDRRMSGRPNATGFTAEEYEPHIESVLEALRSDNPALALKEIETADS